MKYLSVLAAMLFFLFHQALGQDRDPYSTPPGAPLIKPSTVDIQQRLLPNHPGNAGQRVNTSNFVIVESQSTMAAHNMDAQWLSVVTGMGHTAAIYPQTVLDDTLFFASTDALIVSSGIIALTATRVTTIRKFLQFGKPVYLQGEYLTSYSTNIAFQTIVTATGGTFTLGSTVSGSLAPCTVLNNYATTTNSVPSIGYHWYGATATGCNNVEYFMRWSGNNLAFAYCPSNFAYGDLIQNTDQDWVRVGTSFPLMQNIVYAMLSGIACSVVCGSVLNAEHLLLQADPMANGDVNLQWSLDGFAVPGTFVIERNGMQLGELKVMADDKTTFEFTDARLPSGYTHYRVRHTDQNGNETLSGDITLDLGKATPCLRAGAMPGGVRLWLSDHVELASLWLVDMNGSRREIPFSEIHSAHGQEVLLSDAAAGLLAFEGITTTGEMVYAKGMFTR